MRNRYITAVLGGLTLLMLVLSVPASLHEARERGGFYTLSWTFLEEIPQRLTGLGRFRFIFQPLVAMILGILSGRADAKAGRTPFVEAILRQPEQRGTLIKSAFQNVLNVVLMGILLDSVCQWAIYGSSYPGAALVMGPTLILLPYAIARGLSNRLTSLWIRRLT